MRIFVIAHSLTVAGGRSVGTNIIAQLAELTKKHEVLAIVPPGNDYAVPSDCSNIKTVTVSYTSLMQRLFSESNRLPKMVQEFSPDWVWGLGNIGLVNPPCRQAILLQDSHMVYPAKHYALEPAVYRFKKWLVKKRLERCLPRTDIVFCQTNTVAKRFAEQFTFTGEISLCPNAVSKFTHVSNKPEIPTSLRHMGERFKLFVLAKYYAHKNIESLVDMYEQAGDSLADTLCVLTLDPSQHKLAGPLLDRIKRQGLDRNFVNVGSIPQPDLANYFHATDALMMPTLLESFSGTYLEAMNFKRPILTSDIDFAHDICGTAAEYFDPWDPSDIARAVKRLRDEPSRCEELVALGEERLGDQFQSWSDIVRNALNKMGIDPS